eukprot:CAMPEP_0195081490 /NCGR_PEP_ID=MMETSP0448-20130528/22925_1 /TAXON_ID=66468 /ORGANISM="Heterocapsa triquestra, Strain CCMP 448" /LENGTH=110 /DNA_ID=CAMNT_0040114515 /DNA_START=160 /DNA_END=494 /DNA_ORIENTATION=-
MPEQLSNFGILSIAREPPRDDDNRAACRPSPFDEVVPAVPAFAGHVQALSDCHDQLAVSLIRVGHGHQQFQRLYASAEPAYHQGHHRSLDGPQLAALAQGGSDDIAQHLR